MKKTYLTFIGVVCLLLISEIVDAQQAYFIDGYHGGIYGHYPEGQTSFMVRKLQQYPDWNINIEIEPESWDVVKQRDPEGYAAFKQLFKDQSAETGRIEYVNPTYAQSYFWGTSGESAIRQFTYGMQMVRQHFPEAVFTTYSAEEPCFTSCLPSILKSLGYSYASTKNPNTMWGGYVAAYGGELVNWVSPDGSKLLTVPRYACEALQPGSTWQSIAWYNSDDYIKQCLVAGINHPVGMCLQDAAWSHGWDKGPWLGQDTTRHYHPTAYKTWRNYIQYSSTGSTPDDWYFTQEDVRCALMWGTQVMQQLATDIRGAENSVIQAEKMASYAQMFRGCEWPDSLLHEAWRTLLLSQHHDCWIVPYNRLQGGKSWAGNVADWTDVTNENSSLVIDHALRVLSGEAQGSTVRVYNTLAIVRDELVSVETPSSWQEDQWVAIDEKGSEHATQWITEHGIKKLLFRAQVPPAGFAVYSFRKTRKRMDSDMVIRVLPNGNYQVESDLYVLTLNPQRGGIIESLQAKALQNKEFADATYERGFNELRGFFIQENAFLSGTTHSARIEIIEQGPLASTIAIHGKIGSHDFIQTIRLKQGEPLIDMSVKLLWNGDVRIGEPGIAFKADDPRKAFYDDRYKLLLHFPTQVDDPQIYKDAPFDVCKSGLENTFFNRWDSIKHNIILHWVDLAAKDDSYGMALFTDHTTSYAHGEDFPLSMTVQYAGKGLWGKDYIIDRPTDISYALLPHQGNWKQSRLWTQSERRNEPLIAFITDREALPAVSFLSIEDEAYELSSMYFEGKDLYIRLFNAQSDNSQKEITLKGHPAKINRIELDGRIIDTLPVHEKESGNCSFKTSIPAFGLQTIKVSNYLPARNN
ncbi:MAG: glycoside hydrolase [Tannerellaceae bacterium]|jgi:alpha-mannosidase|nr:glycoside hydrolase [Tannerellaceae bacterium]